MKNEENLVKILMLLKNGYAEERKMRKEDLPDWAIKGGIMYEIELEAFQKEKLSNAMASDLHEEWRKTRKRKDGTFEPRIKKSTDEVWNKKHGTNMVDIANTGFDGLPENIKYENAEAAKVAVGLVYDDIKKGLMDSYTNNKSEVDKIIEKKAAKVHNEWLKRNAWVYDSENGDPDLAKPYNELSDKEKAKDRIQIFQAIELVDKFLKRDYAVSEKEISNNSTEGYKANKRNEKDYDDER